LSRAGRAPELPGPHRAYTRRRRRAGTAPHGGQKKSRSAADDTGLCAAHDQHDHLRHLRQPHAGSNADVQPDAADRPARLPDRPPTPTQPAATPPRTGNLRAALRGCRSPPTEASLGQASTITERRSEGLNDGASTLNTPNRPNNPRKGGAMRIRLTGSDGSMPVTTSTIRPVGSRPSSGGHWEHRGCPSCSPRVVDDARSTS
jgi:hypothetical protein